MTGVYNIAIMKPWIWIGITLLAALVGLWRASLSSPNLRGMQAGEPVRSAESLALRTNGGVVQAFRPAEVNATLTAVSGIKVGHTPLPHGPPAARLC